MQYGSLSQTNNGVGSNPGLVINLEEKGYWRKKYWAVIKWKHISFLGILLCEKPQPNTVKKAFFDAVKLHCLISKN